MKSIRMFITVSVAIASVAVGAQQAPVSMTTVAEKEEAYTDGQGIERTRLVPVATVIPGDRIVYTITFANKGEEVADNINVVDPIPEQMRFIAGSAFGPGTKITFSADGGKTFGLPGDITVVDDTGRMRSASPADYTHIRWKFLSPLKPGTQAYAQFKAELK